MEKFELTDFSGGLNEGFAATEFKQGQWSRIKGFVAESTKRMRSQWRIREISSSPAFTPSGYQHTPGSGIQQIYPLAGANGNYIICLYYTYTAPSGAGYSTINYSVGYYQVDGAVTTDMYASDPGRVWPMADKIRDDIYDYVSRDDGTIAWQADHESFRNQNPDKDFTPTLLSIGSVSGLNYRQWATDGDMQFGYNPRFVCTLPYYGGSSGERKNAVLLNCGHFVSGPQSSSLVAGSDGNYGRSYVIYEEGSGLSAQLYDASLPSSAADTDANDDGVLDNGGAMVVSSNIIPKANVGVWWRGQLILGDVEYFADPKGVEAAHSEAYKLYVAAYTDWLSAKDAYVNVNRANKTTTLKQISSLVATVTVNNTTNLAIGDTVFVSNLGASYDGYRVLTGVNAGANTVTFATTGGNQGSTADTDGTVNKTYPILPPTAIATIQPNRNITYITAYNTYILAWKAKFDENKATSSNNGFPTAPSTGSYSAAGLKRYRNGIWFSQPGTFDQFHPFAFTGDLCPSDGQIVGFVPVQDGLLVITTSNGPESVILLRGSSFGYMADDGAVINVRVETVKSSVPSKTIERTETPRRVSHWAQTGAAVYIGKDSGVYATDGESIIKLDNFRETEPQEDKYPSSPITSFPRERL